MRIALGILALATVVQAALVPKELRTDPLEQFRGKWTIVGIDDGEGLQLTGTAGATLHFEGERMSMVCPGTPADECLVVFDTRKSPIKMTLTTKTSVIPGILKIERDRLCWCQALEGNPSPERIRAGDGHRYFLLDRVGN